MIDRVNNRVVSKIRKKTERNASFLSTKKDERDSGKMLLPTYVEQRKCRKFYSNVASNLFHLSPGFCQKTNDDGFQKGLQNDHFFFVFFMISS